MSKKKAEEIDIVFDFLSDYKYAILRGDEDIYKSEDIDIIVHKSDMLSLKRFFLEREYLIIDTNISHPHVQFINYCDDGIVKFDFVTQINIFDKGRRYNSRLDTSTIINSASFGRLKTLPETMKSIILLVHSVYDKKTISYKYYNQIKIEKDDLASQNNFIKQSNIKNIYKLFQLYKAKKTGRLKRNRTLKYVILFLQNIFSFWLIKKILKSPLARINKSIILFMGPDGCGKSTVINNLNKKIDHHKIMHLGNKGNFLFTSRIINKFRNQSTKEHNPILLSDDQKKQNETSKKGFIAKLKNVVFESNLYAEIWSSIVVKSTIQFLKTGKIRLILDRYIYDRKKDTKFDWFILGLYPKPTIAIMLDASIETLLKRKQEHSAQVLQAFKNDYTDFLLKQKFTHVIKINNERELDKVVQKIKIHLA